MSNKLENFDKRLKEAYENYEAPFNKEDWHEIERSLNSSSQSYSTTAAVIGTVLVLGILIGGYFFYNPLQEDPNSGNGSADTTQVENTEAKDPQSPATTKEEPAGELAEVSDEDNVTEFKESTSEEISPKTKGKKELRKSRSQKSQISKGSTSSGKGKKETSEKTLTAEDFSKFSVTTRKGCQGNYVDFQLDHPRENARYLWNFGDGYFSNEANPTHRYSKSGVFDVSLSVTSSNGGNISSNIVQDMIKIVEAPVAEFSFEKVEEGSKIQFNDASSKASEVQWIFGDGHSSSTRQPMHIYHRPGNYEVMLIATNDAGCADTLKKVVRVTEKYNLNAVREFSPNEGETFLPADLKEFEAPFKLSIYNPANGIVIYETTEPGKPWNGTLNGKTVRAGSYPWIVTIDHPEGNSQRFSGKIIVR